MSHVVEIRTEVRDPLAVRMACSRLGLAAPWSGNVRLFSQTVAGLAVQLPNWRYPVVFDITSGSSQFDNFEGRWGKLEDCIASCKRMPLRKLSSKHE